MIKKNMKFLIDNWFLVLFLVVLIYLLVQSQINENKYKKENSDFKLKVKNLEIKISKDIKVIDSLCKLDSIYSAKIEKLKSETKDKIKFVDTMSVSDMQSFYSDRYSSKEN